MVIHKLEEIVLEILFQQEMINPPHVMLELILIQIRKCVFHVLMAVWVVLIVTDARDADLNLFIIHLINNVMKNVVMEWNLIFNVMMETIRMVMDVQEIAKFNLGMPAQEDLLIIKINVILSNLKEWPSNKLVRLEKVQV